MMSADETVDETVDERDELRAWCTMAGAARATGRSVNTLLRWLDESRASEKRGTTTALPRGAYFAPYEAEQTPRAVGKGYAWRIKLDALRRVHLARGGYYWNSDAAHAVASLPLAAADERRALLAHVETLERELATLRTLVRHDASSLTNGATRGARRPGRKSVTRLSALAPVLASVLASDIAPLDVEWEAFSAWAMRNALDYRTAQRLRAQGVIPAPREGRWERRGATIKAVYDAEQRAHADVALARWREQREPLREDREDREDR